MAWNQALSDARRLDPLGTRLPAGLRPGEAEERLATEGFRLICGADEAGRGPLAGSVVAAAVVLAEGFELSGLRDSKKLTAQAREALLPRIYKAALAFSICESSPSQIDQMGILHASMDAMRRAALDVWQQLREKGLSLPDVLVVDGSLGVPGFALAPQRLVVKGDDRCWAIAAASVLAKTTRDAQMLRADKEFPGYGFADHKGYGTAAHLLALRERGPCPLHRQSFSPVAQARPPIQSSLW